MCKYELMNLQPLFIHVSVRCLDFSLNIFNVKYIHNFTQLTRLERMLRYRCNSFIVDLRHKFAVRNINEIHVFVQSSELSNRT